MSDSSWLVVSIFSRITSCKSQSVEQWQLVLYGNTAYSRDFTAHTTLVCTVSKHMWQLRSLINQYELSHMLYHEHTVHATDRTSSLH